MQRTSRLPVPSLARDRARFARQRAEDALPVLERFIRAGLPGRLAVLRIIHEGDRPPAPVGA